MKDSLEGWRTFCSGSDLPQDISVASFHTASPKELLEGVFLLLYNKQACL